MKTVVVAFNYADFKSPKKIQNQKLSLQVLSSLPEWIFPVNFSFSKEHSQYLLEKYNIPTIYKLKRNSKIEINNNRDLPYIKEILDLSSRIHCGKIGYINSDILVRDDFCDTISKDFDAFIFSRKDIAEVDAKNFISGNFKVIYGGDSHVGADGFFFDRLWWTYNSKLFPNDLIIGETEWDSCYRCLIKKYTKNFIEKRVLYHVYHDAKWDVESPGAINNIKIWKDLT